MLGDRPMIKRLAAWILLAVTLPLAACAIKPMTDEERARQIITSAELTYEKFLASQDRPMERFRQLLPRAEGIVILPGVVKGGFIVGAEGGNGVLLAKDASGAWGQPAFYLMAAGSVGLQAGAQVGDMILLVFSRDAVGSIITHQGKLSADLGLTIGTVGAGVEAATTTNIGADVLAFTQGIGVFAGGALEAAALIRRSDLNTAFYGQPVTPADIVLHGSVRNPAADGLRGSLAGQR